MIHRRSLVQGLIGAGAVIAAPAVLRIPFGFQPIRSAFGTYLATDKPISSKTVNGASALAFSLADGWTNRYKGYRCVVTGLSTNGAVGFLCAQDGAGTVFDTGANYTRGGWTQWVDGVRTAQAFQSLAIGNQIGVDTTPSAGYGLGGDVLIQNPGTINGVSQRMFYEASMVQFGGASVAALPMYFAGYYMVAGFVSGIQFRGDLNPPGVQTLTGTVDLYGVRGG